MHKRHVAQRSLLDQAMDFVLSVFQPDEKLKKMNAIIEDNADIVTAIHGDLTWMLKDSGRSGLLSAERVFRPAILKQWKGYSYRELRERIHDGGALRWFCRFHSDPVPHFTAL